MTEKTTILGVQFDNVDLDGAAQRTKELIETSNKSCKLIVAPNTEFIINLIIFLKGTTNIFPIIIKIITQNT